VSWKERIINAVISERVQLQRHTAVIDIVKRRKLQLFEHICRMDNNRLVKQIMLGMANSIRLQGRPARQWSDDISDWCSCNLPDAVHLTSKRGK